MAHTLATLVPANEDARKALVTLAAKVPFGIYEIRTVPSEDGSDSNYCGWIQILPDGTVDIGRPG